jgi:hypothetical protein
MKMYGAEPCAARALPEGAPPEVALPEGALPEGAPPEAALVAATAASVPPSSALTATATTRTIRFLGDSDERLMAGSRMIFLEGRSGRSGQEPPKNMP